MAIVANVSPLSATYARRLTRTISICVGSVTSSPPVAIRPSHALVVTTVSLEYATSVHWAALHVQATHSVLPVLLGL